MSKTDSSTITLKTTCLACRREISSNNFKQHVDSQSCRNSIGSDEPPKSHKNTKTNGDWRKTWSKTCMFCSIETSEYNHEAFCSENPNRKQRTNQFIVAKETGTEYIVKDSTRKKISKNSTGRTHSVETREKMSSKKREDVKNNPEKYRGRYNRGYVKKFECTNGFTVLGTWERDFVEFCLLNDIKIEQPKTGFSYVYEKVERTYFPDFFLPESDEYIEIKGFKVAKDEAKWDYLRNVHKKRLIVLGGPPSWILTNDRSFMRRLL